MFYDSIFSYDHHLLEERETVEILVNVPNNLFFFSLYIKLTTSVDLIALVLNVYPCKKL